MWMVYVYVHALHMCALAGMETTSQCCASLPWIFLFFSSSTLIYCVYAYEVCVWGVMLCSEHVEVRGQLPGVSSLL